MAQIQKIFAFGEMLGQSNRKTTRPRQTASLRRPTIPLVVLLPHSINLTPHTNRTRTHRSPGRHRQIDSQAIKHHADEIGQRPYVQPDSQTKFTSQNPTGAPSPWSPKRNISSLPSILRRLLSVMTIRSTFPWTRQPNQTRAAPTMGGRERCAMEHKS